RIYARPLELHVGLRIPQPDVEQELRDLGYPDVPREGESGWFARSGNELEIALRAFVFWDGPQPAKRLRVAFDGGAVTALRDAGGAELPLVRLEPLPIGGIYPANNEDRVLVRLSEVPQHFVQALIATEDRQFYSHKGFDPRALVRAALSLASDKVQAYYDPYRHPQRALERRNLVLRETREHGSITLEQYAAARATELGVTRKPAMGTSPYPAFLRLVHRQMRRDYDEADLRSEGL